ncbi:hypothetical protein ACIGMX_06550 [Streptomyces aquilus]|uniref:hypothetical protein n=1 Tax=Streptomyces aquilus TaxID=2548456 RepID=UPI0037D299D3
MALLVAKAAVDIAEAQKVAWENKLNEGFDTTNIALEYGLLTTEVGEAFTAWRKGLSDQGEELADVSLFLTPRWAASGDSGSCVPVCHLRKNAIRHRT